MRKHVCDHEWIVDFDPVAEAECYTDGLNYLPAEYICTKCGKRKRIKYEDGQKRNDIFLIPAFVAFVVGLFLVQIVALAKAVYQELFSKQKV